MRCLLSILSLILACGFVPVHAQEPDRRDASSRAETLEALVKSVVTDAAVSSAVLADFDPKRADAATWKAARALKATQVQLELTKQPLEGVLGLFAKVAGVPFTLTAKAREAARTNKIEVTFATTGLPLENVVNLLMDQLGDYRFAVRHGAIVCGLKDEHKPRAVLVVYNVSDIIRPRPDFPAPGLGLGVKDEVK